VLALRDRGPAVIFERTGIMPVLGNLLNSRRRFAQGLGIPVDELDDRCQEALERPILPIVVDRSPEQEVVHQDPSDLAQLLPVPTWFERERGPYITAGVIVAKDPETGRRNVSIARLRLEGGVKIMAGIAKNHHLYMLAEKAKTRGQKLQIAVAIGKPCCSSAWFPALSRSR
jgi:2,5-furandicarboxylate decarboxylase 1